MYCTETCTEKNFHSVQSLQLNDTRKQNLLGILDDQLAGESDIWKNMLENYIQWERKIINQ